MLANLPPILVNRLLGALPAVDRRNVLAACETVELAFADLLYSPGDRLRHVYFPMGCFISLIMSVDEHAALEVGLIGDEGMFGSPLTLGIDASPVRAVVQGAGSALRMDAATFRRELARSPAFQRRVERFLYVQLGQLSQTAACTRFHLVEARLARLLLMTQDRAHASSFHITQQYLAFMLGVRRVGVTEAAGALQDRKLISYRRGNITVLDRRGLKVASCGCYRADIEAYEGIMS